MEVDIAQTVLQSISFICLHKVSLVVLLHQYRKLGSRWRIAYYRTLAWAMLEEYPDLLGR